MRLGLISSYPPIECGVGIYSQYLTEALREKRIDVYVVSHIGGTGHQVFPCFDYEDADLAEKAFSMMVRFTPDVVHIQHEFSLFGKHFGVSVIPLMIQFRLIGIPVVTTLHTVYSEIPQNHKLILQAIVSNSNQIILHESYQKRSLQEVMSKELTRKIAIIPHGAREVAPLPKAKEFLGLPVDRKIILMIGYFRPSKNFELVIDIFPEILKKFSKAILVIAGKTRGREYVEYRNMLFDKIANSPKKEQIYLISRQFPQEVFDKLISSADVVVLPYKISSQSGILAHCLAFGKPVVASNSKAMKHVLERSGAGVICPDNSQFVENIVRVLSDDQCAQELSRNARKYVKEVISWSRVADQHLDIYKTLIDSSTIQSHIITVE